MQRIASRGTAAKKAAQTRKFGTSLGVTNPRAKRLKNPIPIALRRSKRTQQWLEKRAADRKAQA